MAAVLAVAYLLLAIGQRLELLAGGLRQFRSVCLGVLHGSPVHGVGAECLLCRDGGVWLLAVAARQGGRRACTCIRWPLRATRSHCWHHRGCRLVNCIFPARATRRPPWPFVDSMVTWSSVFATFLVARKVYENWHWWLVIDSVELMPVLHAASVPDDAALWRVPDFDRDRHARVAPQSTGGVCSGLISSISAEPWCRGRESSRFSPSAAGLHQCHVSGLPRRLQLHIARGGRAAFRSAAWIWRGKCGFCKRAGSAGLAPPLLNSATRIEACSFRAGSAGAPGVLRKRAIAQISRSIAGVLRRVHALRGAAAGAPHEPAGMDGDSTALRCRAPDARFDSSLRCHGARRAATIWSGCRASQGSSCHSDLHTHESDRARSVADPARLGIRACCGSAVGFGRLERQQRFRGRMHSGICWRNTWERADSRASGRASGCLLWLYDYVCLLWSELYLSRAGATRKSAVDRCACDDNSTRACAFRHTTRLEEIPREA